MCTCGASISHSCAPVVPVYPIHVHLWCQCIPFMCTCGANLFFMIFFRKVFYQVWRRAGSHVFNLLWHQHLSRTSGLIRSSANMDAAYPFWPTQSKLYEAVMASQGRSSLATELMLYHMKVCVRSPSPRCKHVTWWSCDVTWWSCDVTWWSRDVTWWSCDATLHSFRSVLMSWRGQPKAPSPLWPPSTRTCASWRSHR